MSVRELTNAPLRRRGRSRWCQFSMLLSACALSFAPGCSQNLAPTGWLESAPHAQDDPYGAWIQVEGLRGPILLGEFLAVDRDSVYVLPLSGQVESVAITDARGAQLAFYDPAESTLAAWTLVGMVSTLSNGFYLLLTLPTWAVGGALATGSQSRAMIRRVRAEGDWANVAMYARFPAGLPSDLPRTLPTKPIQGVEARGRGRIDGPG